MQHEYSFQVRGYEIDSFNHVNNGVYLNYLEQERWTFFHDTNWLEYMKSNGLYPVVVEANIKYVRELKVFDKAVIKSNWRNDGEHLIADQIIYFEGSNLAVAKAKIKMLLVSSERVVHDLPDFIKQGLNAEVFV